jgi:hypothetical protein
LKYSALKHHSLGCDATIRSRAGRLIRFAIDAKLPWRVSAALDRACPIDGIYYEGEIFTSHGIWPV